MKPTRILDTSGMLCPIPMLKTKQALKRLHAGEILQVITTDPASEKDIQTLLSITQDRLLQLQQVEQRFIFTIEKN